jgi:nucleoside-diphosphate-sugar epimerase
MIKHIDKLNGEIYNLGTNEEMSVKEAAELIIELTNSTSRIIYRSQQEAFGNYQEIKRRFANTTKAKNKFKFKINYTSTQVIKEIINHHKV